MATFTGFKMVQVTNPNTQEVSKKLRVVSSLGEEFDLLTDVTVEDIKADRATFLSKVIIKQGPFKPYALFRNSEVLEEF
jgi:hypothetical protein